MGTAAPGLVRQGHAHNACPHQQQGTAVRRSHAPIATSRVAGMSVSARYRGKGTDLSAVPSFQNSAEDTGSTAVQVARLSARVTQLTDHLKEHKKDYAAQRGLLMTLGQRKSLLKYLYAQDRELYMRTVSELGIRDKLSMLI